MIHGLHHTAISTPDLDRAVAFYCGVLGFQQRAAAAWDVGTAEADRIVGLRDSAARVVMLWAGNTHLEIFEYRSPDPRPRPADARVCDHGVTHICLDVTDIEDEYRRLTAAGMTFNGPPQSIFGVRSIYGADPDGNVIELQEVVDNAPLAMPPEAQALPRRLPAAESA